MSRTVTIHVNGKPLEVAETRHVAAVLLETQGPKLRTSQRAGEARGMYCGMGICFECLVTIDGRPLQRACMTVVRPGMRIDTP